MAKHIQKGNKIIVIISIILLLTIAGFVGYKYYDANKDDDSIYIINKINKIVKK